MAHRVQELKRELAKLPNVRAIKLPDTSAGRGMMNHAIDFWCEDVQKLDPEKKIYTAALRTRVREGTQVLDLYIDVTARVNRLEYFGIIFSPELMLARMMCKVAMLDITSIEGAEVKGKERSGWPFAVLITVGTVGYVEYHKRTRVDEEEEGEIVEG